MSYVDRDNDLVGYVGNSPISEVAGVRREWPPTNGTGPFSITYVPGYLDVFVNGAKLGSADFTATSGVTFTLTTAVTDQDLVSAIAWAKGDMAPLAEIEARTPQLIQEVNLSGLDTTTSPIEIPIDPAYDHELKLSGYSNTGADNTLFMRVGDANGIKTDAVYFQIYCSHIGSSNAYDGNYLSSQNQIILTQDFLSNHVGGVSQASIFTRGLTPGKMSGSVDWLGYLASTSLYNGTGHMMYNNAGTDPLTRLQLYTNAAGTWEAGLIQLYRMPKLL